MKKRSVLLKGHATSVSVEDPFWTALRRMAAERDVPVAALIHAIDLDRDGANLSSAIRIAVLADLQERLARAEARAGTQDRSAPP